MRRSRRRWAITEEGRVKRKIDLPKKVWGYIDQCLASGLYGLNRDEVILSLMRTGGFEQAVKIGVIKFEKS